MTFLKNPVDGKIERAKKRETPQGFYIKTVVVYIQNSKGKLLIQKTSKQKSSEWATTGGHVSDGFSSLDTVHNEILEELGVDIPKSKIEFIQTEYSPLFPFALQDDYLLKTDLDIDTLHLQKEEVEFVKWMTIEEIQKLIKENNFRIGNIPFFKYLIRNKQI